jgi:hypothetical protein
MDGWESMANDIERYQKIKGLSIDAFRAILTVMPQQVRLTIQNKVNQLEESDPLFEYDDLLNFLKLTQIIATGLISNLDDKNIHDYAGPHQAAGMLDRLLRHNEGGKYSEENMSQMGASFSLELMRLKAGLQKIDWKKGWKDD